MARKQIKTWIRLQKDVMGVPFKREVDAYLVTINGVQLAAHKSPPDQYGMALWNLSDIHTGSKVGSKRSSLEQVIKLGRNFVRNLEKKFEKPFSQIIEEKQKFWGDVNKLPLEEEIK